MTRRPAPGPDRNTLRQLGAVAAVAALAGAASGALGPPGVLDGLAEDAALALAYAVTAPAPVEGVMVVAVDPRSLAAPELSDLPRPLMGPVWASAASTALEAGATAVALDFILAFDSARLMLDGQPALRRWDDPLLRLLLREGRAGRVVIGASRNTAPAPRIARVAGPAGVAFVDLPVDPDGVVRRAPTSLPRLDGGAAPTLGGAMLRAAGVADPPLSIRLAARRPLDAVPAISLIDLMRCHEPSALADALRGRVVLVGSVMPGEDRHRAPDRFMPAPRGASAADPCAFARPETRDAAPDTVPGVSARQRRRRRAGRSDSHARRRGTGGGAGRAGRGGGRRGAVGAQDPMGRRSAAGPKAGALALGAGGVLLGHVAPVGRLMLGAAAGGAALWALRAAFSDRRVRLLRDSFGRHLALHLVDQLLRQERPPALTGETREIAIMFADLSGFTALSARTDSAVLTAAVNRYLGVIAEAVEAGGGHVDKFIGDAVMALWNAPVDQPEPAVAALRVARAAAAAVAAQAARDRAAGAPAFDVKIAVSAGPATVGSVGHRARMNYTAIGPAVNMAARLEALPSCYGAPVVLDAKAAAQCEDAFAVLRIGYVALKGVPGPVSVHAPLFDRAAPPADAAATRWPTGGGVISPLRRPCGTVWPRSPGPASGPPAPWPRRRRRGPRGRAPRPRRSRIRGLRASRPDGGKRPARACPFRRAGALATVQETVACEYPAAKTHLAVAAAPPHGQARARLASHPAAAWSTGPVINRAARRWLKRDEAGQGPGQHHAGAVARAPQKQDRRRAPQPPGRAPRQAQPAEIGHGVRLARLKRVRKRDGAPYTYDRRRDGKLAPPPNGSENAPDFLRVYADAVAPDARARAPPKAARSRRWRHAATRAAPAPSWLR